MNALHRTRSCARVAAGGTIGSLPGGGAGSGEVVAGNPGTRAFNPKFTYAGKRGRMRFSLLIKRNGLASYYANLTAERAAAMLMQKHQFGYGLERLIYMAEEFNKPLRVKATLGGQSISIQSMEEA